MSPGNVPPHSCNVDQAVHVAIWTGSPLRNKGDISVGELHGRPLNIAWEERCGLHFRIQCLMTECTFISLGTERAPDMT